MTQRTPSSTLFPYTTLFRSVHQVLQHDVGLRVEPVRDAGRDVQRLPRLLRAQRDLLGPALRGRTRSEEHTSELQSHVNLVCRLLLVKKKVHKSVNILNNKVL